MMKILKPVPHANTFIYFCKLFKPFFTVYIMIFNTKKNILVAPTHYYYYKFLACVYFVLVFVCFMFSFIIFIKLVKLIPY